VKILIVGAGGHAQVVADAIMAAARDQCLPHNIVGYLDDDPALLGRSLVGGCVLGRVADHASIPHDCLIVAMGANADRQRIFLELTGQGSAPCTVRHPASVIAPDVVLGRGVMIMAGVVVNTATVIGQNVILNTSCSVDHHSAIGDHAHVAPGVHLGGSVSVGAGALVGVGAIVLPGCRIGEGATVGAGAVVLRDVPDHATVVGNPAGPIRMPNRRRRAGR